MMRVVPGPLAIYLTTTQTYAIKGNWRQLTGSSKNLSLTGDLVWGLLLQEAVLDEASLVSRPFLCGRPHRKGLGIKLL